MVRRIALALALSSFVACDDEPTGNDRLTDLADVAGESFELSGIGTIGGYRDLAPGTLGTGTCPADPELLEETDFREGELSFTDDSWVLELRVRTHCWDPDAEVIIPDWSPVTTRQFSGSYTIEGDHIPLGPTLYGNASAYLEDGRLRVEFEPVGGQNINSGVVLLFE